MDSSARMRAKPAGAGLALRGIRKAFGPVAALDGIDLEVKSGEFLTILGPSGSGKTTLLKIVAGFELPEEGDVLLGGEDMTFTAPAKRNVGMVFQNYALFPHMDVRGNIAFPLEVRRLQRHLGLTTVFITHDQEEALILSDRIAVMNRGRIQQVALPRELYERPANAFVADFVGESNLLFGRIAAA